MTTNLEAVLPPHALNMNDYGSTRARSRNIIRLRSSGLAKAAPSFNLLDAAKHPAIPLVEKTRLLAALPTLTKAALTYDPDDITSSVGPRHDQRLRLLRALFQNLRRLFPGAVPGAVLWRRSSAKRAPLISAAPHSRFWSVVRANGASSLRYMAIGIREALFAGIDAKRRREVSRALVTITRSSPYAQALLTDDACWWGHGPGAPKRWP